MVSKLIAFTAYVCMTLLFMLECIMYSSVILQTARSCVVKASVTAWKIQKQVESERSVCSDRHPENKRTTVCREMVKLDFAALRPLLTSSDLSV